MYIYDNLNRETTKVIPGGTGADVTYAYDLSGRRLSALFTSGGQGVTYSYDTAGRLSGETSFGRALSFQYDAASNRTRIAWPDANYVQYTYDNLNRTDQVRENGATSGAGLLADYAYDALSRRTGIVRAGSTGAATVYGYDNASRLVQLDQDLIGGTANDQEFDFAYTNASQVSQRVTSNDNYLWPGTNFTRSYARNGLNQYTNVGGSAFNYDARGNLISDGARNFQYDLENRLIQVSGAASMTLAYDPLGRLRQTTTGGVTRDFLYDGDALVAEYEGSTLVRRYVHGAGVDEPLVWYQGSGLTDRRWLIADHQGTIIAHQDGAGATQRYTYGPYGEPDAWGAQGTLARFRYTGQAALPEVGLYHYKARVYDPVLGRFPQTDPVGYEDDLNLYAYVGADPLSATDPRGTDTVRCNEAEGGLECFLRRDDENDRIIFELENGTTIVTYMEDGDLTRDAWAERIAEAQDFLGIEGGGTLQEYWLSADQAAASWLGATILADIVASRYAARQRVRDVEAGATNTHRGRNTQVRLGGKGAAERAFQRETGARPNSTGVTMRTNSRGERIVFRPAGASYPRGTYIVERQTASGRFISKDVYIP
jgi:RHS repeat-associated protein